METTIISREQFLKGNFKKRNDNIENHPVFIFLKNHPSNAYTVKRIMKETKYKHDAVRHTLQKLIKMRKVDHKTPFYIIKK